MRGVRWVSAWAQVRTGGAAQAELLAVDGLVDATSHQRTEGPAQSICDQPRGSHGGGAHGGVTPAATVIHRASARGERTRISLQTRYAMGHAGRRRRARREGIWPWTGGTGAMGAATGASREVGCGCTSHAEFHKLDMVACNASSLGPIPRARSTYLPRQQVPRMMREGGGSLALRATSQRPQRQYTTDEGERGRGRGRGRRTQRTSRAKSRRPSRPSQRETRPVC
jgi:hypothetical protein